MCKKSATGTQSQNTQALSRAIIGVIRPTSSHSHCTCAASFYTLFALCNTFTYSLFYNFINRPIFVHPSLTYNTKSKYIPS